MENIAAEETKMSKLGYVTSICIVSSKSTQVQAIVTLMFRLHLATVMSLTPVSGQIDSIQR